MFGLIRTLLLIALLSSCAASPPRPASAELPQLRLSPASLGRELALQQRLEAIVGDKRQTLEALLEVDSRELRLGVQALGQSALTLRWDGKALQQHRADWLPPTLSGDRVLFDLQLVFWPAQAIRAVLPEDWSLQESGKERQLLHAGVVVVSVSYPEADHAVLSQTRENYRLDITSTAVSEPRQ